MTLTAVRDAIARMSTPELRSLGYNRAIYYGADRHPPLASDEEVREAARELRRRKEQCGAAIVIEISARGHRLGQAVGWW